MSLVLYDTSPPEPGERAEQNFTSQEMEIVDPMTDYEIPSSPPKFNTYISAQNKPEFGEKVNQYKMNIENSSDPLAGPSFPNKRQALCEANDFPSLPRPATVRKHAQTKFLTIRSIERAAPNTGQ
ncbi:hypothetical protein GcC1_200051 [Golovinomyces cichoracearum]|uniref:Uncharacterized protein n=1 Tax=Golovinomyces cichoracearum TaxID=62708 RepID=A0A420HED9_9PEZI|nr:hypothetical protein GcC1_200051 [Golovinomyces cichoracearum]